MEFIFLNGQWVVLDPETGKTTPVSEMFPGLENFLAPFNDTDNPLTSETLNAAILEWQSEQQAGQDTSLLRATEQEILDEFGPAFRAKPTVGGFLPERLPEQGPRLEELLGAQPPLQFSTFEEAQAAAPPGWEVGTRGGFFTVTPGAGQGTISADSLIDDMLLEWVRTGDDSILEGAQRIFQAQAFITGETTLTRLQAAQIVVPYARTLEEAVAWVDALAGGQQGFTPSEQAKQRGEAVPSETGLTPAQEALVVAREKAQVQAQGGPGQPPAPPFAAGTPFAMPQRVEGPFQAAAGLTPQQQTATNLFQQGISPQAAFQPQPGAFGENLADPAFGAVGGQTQAPSLSPQEKVAVKFFQGLADGAAPNGGTQQPEVPRTFPQPQTPGQRTAVTEAAVGIKRQKPGGVQIRPFTGAEQTAVAAHRARVTGERARAAPTGARQGPTAILFEIEQRRQREQTQQRTLRRGGRTIFR